MKIVLAGRRIDAKESKIKRFPLGKINIVKAKLDDLFQQIKPSYLICSGACGADLIGLEIGIKSKIKCKMVLPYQVDSFIKRSVIDRPGEWFTVFDKVYETLGPENIVNLNLKLDDQNVYLKTNNFILDYSESINESKLKAAVIIWDGCIKLNDRDFTSLFKIDAIKQGYRIHEILTK